MAFSRTFEKENHAGIMAESNTVPEKHISEPILHVVDGCRQSAIGKLSWARDLPERRYCTLRRLLSAHKPAFVLSCQGLEFSSKPDRTRT